MMIVMKDFFLKLMFNILKMQIAFTNDLLFLSERIKTEKVEKLVANPLAKKEYFIHIRNLNQVLIHGKILEKVLRFIENVRKHRAFKLVTTEVKKYYLVSERKYHITKKFSENLLVIEMEKPKS